MDPSDKKCATSGNKHPMKGFYNERFSTIC